MYAPNAATPTTAGHEEHREPSDLGIGPDPGQGAEPDEDRELGGQTDDEAHPHHAEGEDGVQDEDGAEDLGHVRDLGGDVDHGQPADQVHDGVHDLLGVPALEAVHDRQPADDERERDRHGQGDGERIHAVDQDEQKAGGDPQADGEPEPDAQLEQETGAEVHLERPLQPGVLEPERQPVAVEVEPVSPVALGLVVRRVRVVLVCHRP